MLIAVSSTRAAERLAPGAVDLAGRLDARVIVVHIVHTREEDKDESDARERAQQTLAQFCASLTEAGVDCERILLFADDIASAIVKTARAQGASLIVIGASEQSSWTRFFRGDIAAILAQKSDVPTLVIPSQWKSLI